VPIVKFNAILKVSLLSLFFMLNVVDMIQTVFLLEMRLESNPVAVYYPQFWFPLNSRSPLSFLWESIGSAPIWRARRIERSILI